MAFRLSPYTQHLLVFPVVVTNPHQFFSLLERNLRMKCFLGVLLGLMLVVGCADSGSAPSGAPESGSSAAVGANLQTVVFNVPGMT